MSHFKVSDFFNTVVDKQTFIIYHAEGCQTLDFGVAKSLPRQTKVLTSLKVLGVDINTIYGLQYGGRNKYTLYPLGKNPILGMNEVTICGLKVAVRSADPIIRNIKPRTMDVFIL
ncbi:hypothetical protein ACJMK2_003475 [Sinanodonta woodiana]|uniref:Uncharacterized protein n=1 Tax=Sinanodonta woodiana TaxID=1069815 RepID=A0ABD3XYC3_SINWO